MSPVPWHSLEPTMCENFISIMLLRQHPDGTRRRPAQGDKGIDVIVPVAENPRIYDVYQIKYFYSSLNSSRRSQISNSASTLLKAVRAEQLQVRNWHLVLPLDPHQHDEEWLESLFSGTNIRAYWKGLTHLEGWAAKYRDVVDYYVYHGAERINGLLESALRLAEMRRGAGNSGLSVESVHTGLVDIFVILNADDPHYRYDLSVSSTDAGFDQVPPGVAMSQITKRAEGGPTVRIDVYPKFKEAVLERPIRHDLLIKIPTSDVALIEKVENFRTFGEAVTIPAGFVHAEMDDPIAGTTSSEAIAVRIEPIQVKPVRLRLIVEESGTRKASTFCNVEKLTEGLLGGYVACLRSDSGTIVAEHRVGKPAQSEAAASFNLRVEWHGQVALKVIEDLRFANEVRAPRKVVLAGEFVGPYTEIASIDIAGQRLIPGWLLEYAESLAALQDYADEPLKLASRDVEDNRSVVEALNLGRLLKGHTLEQTQPRWIVRSENLQGLAAEVNEANAMAWRAPLVGKIEGAVVTIPDVLYSADNVAAQLVVVGGEEGVVLTGTREGVRISIRL